MAKNKSIRSSSTFHLQSTSCTRVVHGTESQFKPSNNREEIEEKNNVGCLDFSRAGKKGVASLFGKPDDKVMRMYKEIDSKIEKVHHILRNDDGDAEIVELCSQLAGEIEAKTSFALEIERLKQNREIERKTEESEKEAQSDAYATFLKLNDKKFRGMNGSSSPGSFVQRLSSQKW